ncbi:methyltransferase domain-containing protein [Haloferula sp. A504]|uniref:methyltransferase domain-containing protein n=1 Tax=Haloferula sp. A504 TaxID=3373601 RepID=UPI0031BE7E47|nr:class I SAM-dependent methyltransferase [Verrucomicrobiaceae bacterium E54]
MADAVREIYSRRRYPALSHPETHPGVIAATARCGGVVAPALPEACRLLEIGCASGHNLLPLAARFPESRFVGIDFSDSAIRKGRQHAEATGLANVTFEHADVTEWRPEAEDFDYVVAHGMLSWVDDRVKAALFELVQGSLAPDGIACIGYNTLPGWSLRKEAAAMVRALPDLGADAMGVIGELAEAAAGGATPYAAHLAAIYRDMQRKGPEIVAFDDLGPVCDPLHFGQVIEWAGQHGLRYLGESTLSGNLPPGVDPAALARLEPLAGDPLRFQQTLDLLSGRTHRSSLMCRSGLTLDPATSSSVTLHFAARLLVRPLPSKAIHGEIIEHFHAALHAAWPSAMPVAGLMEECAHRLGPRWDPARGAKTVADWLYRAARFGWVELRTDAIELDSRSPVRPALSPLNRRFAKDRDSLVDVFHRSCGFPETHWGVVEALDGSRSADEIKALARDQAPDLDVGPWLDHLAGRGLLWPG